MNLRDYLTSLQLSGLPPDYTWDRTLFNSLWAVNDEDSPRLAAALGLISVRAAFALGVACCEWVVARVEGHVDTADALLRIEAAWAATADRRYASLPPFPPSPASAPPLFIGPLRLAMKLLSHAHELYVDVGDDLRSRTQGLAMLVDHIAGRHPAFSQWLSESLRAAHAHFPRTSVPIEQEPPVPKEFFDPGFLWQDGLAQLSLDRFVATLDPTKNPYLRSPDDMRADGFAGLPYGRTI